ncbi:MULTISPECIES: WhiB family transcriptional regulator [unclassified Streptomyces]|uniref:WhiB family transcriptional regulator n=1 Tax=unclassified Streptomyces TaxID=2593676 RepID=UPI000DAC3843|nr:MULTISPECIES: WhiB family transcriptional regulator [unclassified Streptomyces]PZT76048.1 hypothetical protein DNK56_21985 [Streptomyces sp. AC1-42W]PZT80001.1 hypothetical protein DNK55_10700 [Streptomyces sp. AC1-42T]
MPLPETAEPHDWRAAAACLGLPPRVIFARRESEAMPALKACRDCPVTHHCEETVAPADTYFDGVAAGRLWRNGRPARLRLTSVASSHEPCGCSRTTADD